MEEHVPTAKGGEGGGGDEGEGGEGEGGGGEGGGAGQVETVPETLSVRVVGQKQTVPPPTQTLVPCPLYAMLE